MIVKVYCKNCPDEGLELQHDPEKNSNLMNPLGPLLLAPDKTQWQLYACPNCGIEIGLTINTTKNE